MDDLVEVAKALVAQNSESMAVTAEFRVAAVGRRGVFVTVTPSDSKRSFDTARIYVTFGQQARLVPTNCPSIAVFEKEFEGDED